MRNRPARAARTSAAPVAAPAPALVVGTSVAEALALANACSDVVGTSPVMQVPGALTSPTIALAWGAPAVVAAPAASTPVHPTQVLVKLGKPYNVRSGTQFDNVASWQATCAFLASKGGQATVGEIAQHLKELRNHANFAGYAVRRGYLQPVAG